LLKRLRIQQKHLRLISRRFWGTLFSLVIAFAVLLQVARQAFPLINDYRPVIEEALSEQLGVNVSIASIDAEWNGLRPNIQLNQVEVTNQLNAQVIFSVQTARAEFSILDTLVQRGLAFRRITFDHFSSALEQKNNGAWKIAGYDGGTANTQNQFSFDDPLDIFLFGRRVEILNAELGFNFVSGKTSVISVPRISLENDRYFHRLVTHLDVDSEERSLVFVVEGYGDPRDEKEFSASGYLNLRDLSSRKLLEAITGRTWDAKESTESVVMDERTLNLELWFKGSPHFGMTLSGQLDINGSPVDELKSVQLPTNFFAEISGAWHEENGWFINLQDVALEWVGKKAPLQQVSLYGKGKQVGLRIPEVDVGYFSQMLLEADVEALPDVERALRELNPQGLLKNVDVQLTEKSQGYFLASALVEDFSTESYRGSPVVKNVDGYVESTLFSGYFDLDSPESLSFHPIKAYAEPLVGNNVKAQVKWQISFDDKIAYVHSNLMQADVGDSHAKAYLALSLPFSKKVGEPEMTLFLGANAMSAEHYRQYLPSKMPQDLSGWLQRSIKSGQANNIGVMYHGSLEKGPSVEPNVQLFADIEKLDLSFDSAWPTLENVYGEVYVNNALVDAKVSSATMLGNQVAESDFSVKRLVSGERQIAVSAKALGTAGQAKLLMLESPLRQSVGSFLPSWKMTGSYEADVNLSVPLSFKEEDIDYQISADLKKVDVILSEINLELKATEGRVHFSRDGLFEADDLLLEAFDSRFKIDISSDTDLRESYFNFEGRADNKALKKWLDRPEMEFVEGDVGIVGRLILPFRREDGQSLLSVNVASNLDGVAVDLPAPLGKLSSDSGQFIANIDVFDESTSYHLNYNELIQVEVDSHNQEGIALSIYTDTQNKPDTGDNARGFLHAQASLNHINFSAWNDTRRRYVKYVEQYSDSDESVVTQAEFDISRLDVSGYFIDEVHVSAKGDADEWVFDVSSPTVKGAIHVPADESLPMLVDLDYVHLQSEEQENLVAIEQGFVENHVNRDNLSAHEKSVFEGWDLSGLSAMNVTLKDFKVDQEDYGHWNFKLRPVENGLKLEEISGFAKEIKVGSDERGADFLWLQDEGQVLSHFQGDLHIKGVSKALLAWDQEALLDARDANIYADLQWQTYPDLISLANIEGNINLNLQNGSFIRGGEAGENPLLRLIALFNFDTLARRLRLDFSDLAAKGFAFDKVYGDMSFDKGQVFLTTPVIVESSSSKMQMAGTVNVSDETIDSELVVTLPVGGNLAVATAFVAGLPAGLGVYIVSKMFGRQMDKVSSINYAVTGEWEDPKIKVKRIFDDTGASKKGKRLEDSLPKSDESAALRDHNIPLTAEI
jgi:uncharacterized protein (TIGR02099 family)